MWKTEACGRRLNRLFVPGFMISVDDVDYVSYSSSAAVAADPLKSATNKFVNKLHESRTLRVSGIEHRYDE